jgi:hypothetical protein
MAMNIDIDRSDLLRVKATMAAIGKSANPVMARAINKTMGNVQTFGVKKTAEYLNLSQKRIRQDFRQIKASPSKVSGAVIAEGDPVGLFSFGAKVLKSGIVSVKMLKKKPPVKLSHAFVSYAKGNWHIFERVWSLEHRNLPYDPRKRYEKMPKKYRFILARLEGLRVEDVYGDDRVLKPTIKWGGEKISVNIASQLDLEWSKLP